MVYVLPIPIIVFQLLALAVGIAIESLIVRYNLGLSRRQSVVYSAIINLYSSILAWLLLFLGHALVPETIRRQIMSYVLFDRFYQRSPVADSTLEALVLAIAFLVICLIEFKGFDLLKFLLEASPQSLAEETPLGLVKHLNATLIRNNARGVSSFFLIGALTNSVILLIFFLRILERYALGL